MTDQNTALDGHTEDLDLTDGALTPAPEQRADPAGSDPTVGDEAGGDGRGKVAAMVAGAIALTIVVLFGMRWARQRRRDTTVVIIDAPEAARRPRLVRRGGVPTAA